MRIGIGRPPGRQDPADWVLREFSGTQRKEVDLLFERGADAVECLIADGLAAAQNEELERALAVAVRTHRDRIRLFGQMSDSARARNLPHAVKRWNDASQESEELISVLENAMASLRKSTANDEA